MTTIIEKLTQIMTTTPDEDKQFLNEVIQEIKVKRGRGRPRIYKDYQDCLACQRQKYHEDPTVKLATVTQYYNDNKERLAIVCSICGSENSINTWFYNRIIF